MPILQWSAVLLVSFLLSGCGGAPEDSTEPTSEESYVLPDEELDTVESELGRCTVMGSLVMNCAPLSAYKREAARQCLAWPYYGTTPSISSRQAGTCKNGGLKSATFQCCKSVQKKL